MFNPNTLFQVKKTSAVDLENCKRLVEFQSEAAVIPSVQHEQLFLDGIKSEIAYRQSEEKTRIDQIARSKHAASLKESDLKKKRALQRDQEYAQMLNEKQNQEMAEVRRKMEQIAEKNRQDSQNEIKVMEMLSTFPEMEWASAKFVLEANNYDLQKAKQEIHQKQQMAHQQHQQAQQFELTLVNMVSNQQQVKFFPLNQEGMNILFHLNQQYPAPPGKHYNLYLHPNGTRPLTYSKLSNKLKDLGLARAQKLYYHLSDEPLF